jgi:hypothetical protein
MIARLLAFLPAALLATQLGESALAAQSVAIDWSHSFGGPNYDDAVFVTADGNGNLFMTGQFSGTIDVGNGPLTSAGATDFFVAKLSPDGAVLWSQRFGGVADDKPGGIATDASGNVFLAGYISSSVDIDGVGLVNPGGPDIIVLSLDPSGAFRWVVHPVFDGAGYANDLKVDSAGRVLVVGAFTDDADLGGGSLAGPSSGPAASGFVLCLNNAGVHQWSTAILGCWDCSVNRWAYGVDVDAAGNVYVSGGAHDSEFVPQTSAFLCKYSPQGNRQWQVTEDGYSTLHSGELSHPRIYDMAVNADGQTFVVGQDLGCAADEYTGCGATMESFSTEAVVAWKKRFAASSPWDIAVDTDSDGNVMVAGSFDSTADFGGGPITSNGYADILVAKYLGATGEHQWSDHLGGTSNDLSTDILSLGVNHFALTGHFYNTTDIDGTSYTAPGHNALIMKGGLSTENAVAISSFDAVESEGTVVLSGEFRSNLGVAGVNLYRSSGAGAFRPVLLANVQDLRTNGFEYVDHDVRPGDTYRYQIGVTDPDGEFLSGIVTISMVAGEIRLFPNRPNPFNPETSIRFSLPASQHVVIIVYDAEGRPVRTLADGVWPRGTHEIAWNGRDDRGTAVSSGVYFCRLEASKVVETRKLVLLK